jgi:ferritin
MLSKNLETAINKQINAEFWSAYLYLSMSTYAGNRGLPGVANWFEVQYKEELDHANKFIKYMIAKGNKVDLRPIEAVPTTWDSVLNLFEENLKHEQVVTGLINDLFALARSEKDFATESLVQWFVDEQVEEEENALNYIDALKLIGDNGYGLYSLDKELATRVYVPLATSTTASKA